MWDNPLIVRSLRLARGWQHTQGRHCANVSLRRVSNGLGRGRGDKEGVCLKPLSNEVHLSVQPGLRGGRTKLSLQPMERPERAGHVAFTMSGTLDQIAALLERAGIRCARRRAGLQIFYKDPAGTLVELNTGWVQERLG